MNPLLPDPRPFFGGTRAGVRAGAALLAAGLLAALAPSAGAHDVVLVPAASELVVRYGHPADWRMVDLDKLVELAMVDADGTTRERRGELRRRGLDLVLAGAPARAPALVAARYDNGPWVRLATPQGQAAAFRNASRLMVPDAAEAFVSLKFAKALVGAERDEVAYGRVVGHLLELVPQRNPLALRVGDTLPVLVRFNGKPLADAGIEDGDLVSQAPEDRIERFRTDANGIAQLPVRRRGLHRLAVDLDVPNDGSLGDAARALGVGRVRMVATYTFRN